MIRRFEYSISVLLLLAAYYLSGKFGLSLAFLNLSASPVWPPTGLALAALLLRGYRLWPAIFLGAFLVNLSTQGSVVTSLGIATGNTLEALLGAWLVNQFANGNKAFERTVNVFKFALFAAVISTLVSASVGVITLKLGGFVQPGQFWPVWSTWWLGDLVSDLIVAPLLVIWLTHRFRLEAGRLIEASAVLVAVVIVGQLVFLRGTLFGTRGEPLEYLAIPPLVWAALRFRQRGAITFAVLMSAIAVWGTLRGFGPFTGPDPNKSLVLLQAFMGTISLTALGLATVASERKRAEQRLNVQDAVTRVLLDARTLQQATPKILQAFCEVGGWDFAAIWRVDRDRKELSCVDAWHMPSAPMPQFEANTRQRTFALGVGLPGLVWSSGRPVWLPDVTQAPNFPRAPYAVKEGLRAAFGFPFKVGDETLGVIECFSREVREPDETFLGMLVSIGSQLGQFLERKRAEGALLAKEAELQLVTDITPVMLTRCTHDRRYRFVNRAYAEMLGLTPAQVINKPIVEVMGKEGYETILPHIEKVLSGETVKYESEVIFKGIGPRFLRVIYQPDREKEGVVIGWLASITDITDRKKAEAALRESQAALKKHVDTLEEVVAQRTAALRETVSELEMFSYSISHDMRAPLRAMQAYAHLLVEEFGSNINHEQKDYLERIIKASERLDQMIRDVLNYSKVARGEFPIYPMDLQKLVTSVIAQDPLLQPPKAQIHVSAPLPRVLGHEIALSQSISNLLSNAVKFVRAGTVPEIRIWSEPHGDKVRIFFQDNGIGIDPKNQARIFNLFERLHSQKEYQGTGIGLAIVKKAIERLGGTVSLKSALGAGTTFCVELVTA